MKVSVIVSVLLSVAFARESLYASAGGVTDPNRGVSASSLTGAALPSTNNPAAATLGNMAAAAAAAAGMPPGMAPEPELAPAGHVVDVLQPNPFAPAFVHASPASASAEAEAVHQEHQENQETGPEVKVYGPAQNFWDKHPASDKLVPLFRYWNPSIRDHFYTIDFGVFGSGREGWVYQGIQCYVYPTNEPHTVPLYRYWNLKLLDDYYTVSSNVSQATGYALKGIAAYVAPTELPGTVPLFRYWNQELADHYYTHNYNVMQHGRDGWVLQGIAAYVWPHPSEWINPGTVANNTSPDAIPGHLLTPTLFVPSTNHHDTSLGEGVDGIDHVDNGDNSTESSIPPTNITLEAQPSTVTPLLVPLYRYWNSVYRDHFYTTLWSEVNAGGRDGWEYQGVQGLVFSNPQPHTSALHRYWNIRTLDHFYTTNFEALGKGGKDGWVYEGIQAYIETAKTPENVPLYRYFSDTYKDHFYTTRFIGQEARTWTYEGVQGFIYPSFFTDC